MKNLFFIDSEDCKPDKLLGERIHSTLVKSIQGLGFTIIGGDNIKDKFLQIKSLVPNGPAWCEGKLQMGILLIFIKLIIIK